MIIGNEFFILFFPIIILSLIYLYRHPEISFGLFIFAYVIKGGINISFFNLTAILFVLAILGFIFPVILGKKLFFKFHASDIWLWIFIMVLLFGCFIANDIKGGLDKVLRFIGIVAIPYFLARVFLQDWERIKRFLFTIFIVAFTYSITIIIYSYTGGYTGGRVEILEANAIPVATLFATGIIIAIIGVADYSLLKRNIASICCAITIPFFVYAFFLVGIRGPVLAAIIGLLFYFLLIFKKTFKFVFFSAIILSVGMVYLAQNYILIQSFLLEKVPNLFLYSAAEISGGQSTMQRLGLFFQAITAFMENPFLGLGTRGFAELSPVLIYPHNIFLEIAAENGIIGLVVFAGFLVAVSFDGIRYLRLYSAKIGRQKKAIGAVVLTVSIMLLVEKQLSYSLEGHKDLFVFLALVVNILQISKRKVLRKNTLLTTVSNVE